MDGDPGDAACGEFTLPVWIPDLIRNPSSATPVESAKAHLATAGWFNTTSMPSPAVLT
jgi:hypothetical protein